MAERASGSKPTGSKDGAAKKKVSAAKKDPATTAAKAAPAPKRATETAAKKASAAKATTAKKVTTAKAGAKKASGAAATAATSTRRPAAEVSAVKAPPSAAKRAAKGATMVKSAESKTASRTVPAKPAAARKGSRSAAETEKIRVALTARLTELQDEHAHTLAELAELQRDRLTDSAGDDQADTGTKTFEREQEITLANTILERVNQVERALERLDEGSYGWCERCGNPIPVERLAAFPSATLCVSCKQLEERR